MDKVMFTNYSEAELIGIIEKALKGAGHFTKADEDDQTYITINEAAQILRVTRPTIHSLIKEGRLTRTRVGKAVRLYRAEVLSIPKRA